MHVHAMCNKITTCQHNIICLDSKLLCLYMAGDYCQNYQWYTVRHEVVLLRREVVVLCHEGGISTSS